MVVWTNGKVAFSRDLIFGLCVMSQEGWFPLDQLDDDDFSVVIDEWDNTPGNPYCDEIRAMDVARHQPLNYTS